MKIKIVKAMVSVVILSTLFATQFSASAQKFEPRWDSIKANYKTPQWFVDAKFVTQVFVKSLALGPKARIKNVDLVGSTKKLLYIQDKTGLRVSMPVESHDYLPFVLRIKGLKLEEKL